MRSRWRDYWLLASFGNSATIRLVQPDALDFCAFFSDASRHDIIVKAGSPNDALGFHDAWKNTLWSNSLGAISIQPHQQRLAGGSTTSATISH